MSISMQEVVFLYISLLCPVSIDFMKDVKTKGIDALLLLLRPCSVIFLSFCIIAATFAISVGPILRISCS